MDLRKFDLNLLVVFEAIYSSGNISRAAQTLNVSQPTISNALTRLRDLVGDPLFVRDGRGVSPTPRAVGMIGPVRNALHMIRAGVAEDEVFDPATNKRNFRLVILDLLEPILMPPIVREVQNHRSVTLEILPMLTTPVIEGLSDGSIDLLLGTYDSRLEDIECAQIGAANIVVAARKGHPAIQGTVTRNMLSEIGHVALVPQLRALSRIDEALRFAQVDRHIVYTVTKFWSFPHIVATTDLIAMLPGDFAREAARFYPLDIYPMPFDFPEQQIYMIWKKQKNNDPGHQWLRQQLLTVFEQRSAAEQG